MKKLLLLLALSLFSAQSFAGSCPDGSEPVKSISADGTYFVFECNNSSSESTAVGNQEYFEIINQTSNDDKYYMELLNFSATKIKNIPADQVAGALLDGIREVGLVCLPWTKEANAWQHRVSPPCAD